ncbi:MAG TPA: RNA 2',3'-cyclic phosphodiesterase [Methylomirabilota bacterium]|nr:RNA 2',3'-cyclic phosphodiesterase [Methylomirabilota bacterium]
MAILLPDSLRAALAAEIERLAPRARDVAWVGSENLHLTLKFLGGVEPERLERVAAALGAAAATVAPFEVALRGLGAFPSQRRPRVVWAGAHTGGAAVTALAARVEDALGPLDFPREARAFSAHVTLGRVREPRRAAALGEALAADAEKDFGRFRVEQVTLMRSDLSPRGARHTALASWPLGGPVQQ